MLINSVRLSGVNAMPVISHPRGPGQETAKLVAARNGGHHLVIAHPLVRFLVDRAGGDVGLDPQDALVIERQTHPGCRMPPPA